MIWKDLVSTNKIVLKKSSKAFRNNPELMVVGAFYLIAVMLAARISSSVGIFGGLIMTLLQSAILSDYLFLMNRIVYTGKFTMADFKSGFSVYFRKVWVVLFVIFVARYGISILLQPFQMILPGAGFLLLLFNFVALLLLNPLPETLYQKHFQELESFSYAFRFSKENVISWFGPNILMGAILYGFYTLIAKGVTFIIKGLPYSVQFSLYAVLIAILLQAGIGYAMVYRGYLFQILSTTTRRKRVFMRNLNR